MTQPIIKFSISSQTRTLAEV